MIHQTNCTFSLLRTTTTNQSMDYKLSHISYKFIITLYFVYQSKIYETLQVWWSAAVKLLGAHKQTWQPAKIPTEVKGLQIADQISTSKQACWETAGLHFYYEDWEDITPSDSHTRNFTIRRMSKMASTELLPMSSFCDMKRLTNEKANAIQNH